jgi:copper chaperone NosL
MHSALKFFAGAAFVLLTFSGLAGAQSGKASASKGPLAALLPLAEDGRLQMSNGDRCPVCGMFPVKWPQSAAGMMLVDGRTFYFCGNGCMLRTWRDAQVHLDISRSLIQRMVVQDYFSGEPLDAAAAFWVAGSDVIGPMGPALVALKTMQEVDHFKSRHGGRIVFQLDQMDDALWNSLFPPR